MSNPAQHLLDSADFVSLRRIGPIDHDYRQAKPTGGVDLGAGAFAASVSGNHKVNPAGFEKVTLCRFGKWPTINDDVVMRQGGAVLRGIDESQEIVMLRRGSEDRDFGSPDGKENSLGRVAKRPGGSGHVRHSGPAIAGAGRPRRSCKRDQGHASGCTRRDRVPAYLRGERVGGVDQVRDGVILEIRGQARFAAKSAGAGRQGLYDGIRHATGVGERGTQPHGGDVRRKGARLGGAAQDQEIWCHV